MDRAWGVGGKRESGRRGEREHGEVRQREDIVRREIS